jgi:hypothetical protein
MGGKRTVHAINAKETREASAQQQTSDLWLAEREIRNLLPIHIRTTEAHGDEHAHKQDLKWMHAAFLSLEDAGGRVHQSTEELGQRHEPETPIS